MKLRRKWMFYWLVFLFSIAIFWGASEPLAQTKKTLTWGSTATTSGSFPYFVVAARILNESIPEINVTVRSTGASVHNARLLEQHRVEIGAVSTQIAREQFLGIKSFQGKPYRDSRVLYVIATNSLHFVVSEESGIKDLKGLEGKGFSPGLQGSGTEQISKLIFSMFGVNPKLYFAGMADAIEAMKDGRIVGISKFGRPPDSAILNIASAKKIRILSWSDAEVEKIVQNIPGLRPAVVPAGKYPGVGEFNTVQDEWSNMVRKDFPEELAYKITKVHWINRDKIHKLAPMFIGERFPKVTVSIRAEGNYLHPGAIKFYRELGLTIPDRLLPPEMK